MSELFPLVNGLINIKSIPGLSSCCIYKFAYLYSKYTKTFANENESLEKSRFHENIQIISDW